ncbi:PDZ domain-containing protein 9 [Paroedura picta]|uniref:PDZ domain-containing protein 9 n=1 Tax=Paroedura picta TaxID=143630 RepID=UPI0040576022
MDGTNLPFRRRPSIRPPLDGRPSVRRPSDNRRSSVRRPSEQRRPSVRRPSDYRRPSVRRSSDYKQVRWLSDQRRPSVRRSSDRRPSYRSSASSSETSSTTYTSEYYGSDEDEESEHGLSTTIKTNIQMEKDGLGFIIVQNGPYLQLTGLVDNSPAARDGKLQAGDVFLKIGHANVLGWTLRELRQLLQGTPSGTVLQTQVYRDFLPLPSRWTSVMDDIPEKNGTDTLSDASEESWTSSEGTDEYEEYGEETDSEGDSQTITDHRAAEEDDTAPIRVHHDKTVHYEEVCKEPEGDQASLQAPAAEAPPPELQWISRDWHFFERKRHTFTVGSDIGCDIMIHKDNRGETETPSVRRSLSDCHADGWNAERDTDDAALYVRWPSPYWTLPKANVASSSSSSSLSEVFWLTDSGEDVE